MKWLVDWCFVRGVNLLYPHAFFYSVRGPRRHERPPDVGPHAPWWDEYKPFADYCRRMCWLNTGSSHICEVAILGQANFLPWPAAKVCFQHQRDFNYLELRHLWEDAQVSEDGIRIAGMHYQVLIVDGVGHIPAEAMPALAALAQAGRLLVYGEDEWGWESAQVVNTPDALIAAIDRWIAPDLTVEPPQPDLRCRHVIKDGLHYYMLCNEGGEPLRFRHQVNVQGELALVDPFTLQVKAAEDELVLDPRTIKLIMAR